MAVVTGHVSPGSGAYVPDLAIKLNEQSELWIPDVGASSSTDGDLSGGGWEVMCPFHIFQVMQFQRTLNSTCDVCQHVEDKSSIS